MATPCLPQNVASKVQSLNRKLVKYLETFKITMYSIKVAIQLHCFPWSPHTRVMRILSIQRGDKERLEVQVRGDSKPTVVYQPVLILSRSVLTRFSLQSIFSQSAERPHERHPMVSTRSHCSPCLSLLEPHIHSKESFS